VALAETAFAGGFGMDIDLSLVPSEGIRRDDFLLFSESQSRFVVTVPPEKRQEFEAIMEETILAEIGRVTIGTTFRVCGTKGSEILSEDIAALKKAWQEPLNF